MVVSPPPRLLPSQTQLLSWLVLLLVVAASRSVDGTMIIGSEDIAHVDPTFDCPATTTCPQLCVPTIDHCPPEMMCPSDQLLCTDGTCYAGQDNLVECLGNHSAVANVICPNECAPIACARLVTTYNVCTSLLEDHAATYEFATSCSDLTSGNSTMATVHYDFAWTGPGYIAAYVWLAMVTLGIILWCWYNNRWAPKVGATKLLQVRTETHIANDPDAHMAYLYQTGYRQHHPLGTLLYIMTMITFFGWYAILAWTTALSHHDNHQVALDAMKTFALVFNIGFLWNLALYWPYSIESLFYRRSNLAQANQVAVHYFHAPHQARQTSIFKSATMSIRSVRTQAEQAPTNTNITNNNNLRKTTFPHASWIPTRVTNFFNSVARLVGTLMALIFAEKPVETMLDEDDPDNLPTELDDQQQQKVDYCPVLTGDDGSRYFVFLFRRYNYDKSQQMFVPGEFSIGTTFGDMKPPRIANVQDFGRDYSVQAFPLKGSNPSTDDNANSSSKCLLHKASQLSPFSKGSSSNALQLKSTDSNVMVQNAAGLTSAQVLDRRRVVGPNMIEMKHPSLWREFRREISKPFYLYQYHILWIWGMEYYYMMMVNWGVILLSACAISWFRYRSARVLYELSHVQGTCTVLRGRDFVTLSQSEMVPGDIVQLEPGTIHCDMVLLTGEAIVDESALTGEATPHSKLPIDLLSEELYDPTLHTRQTLSAGTKVLETHQAMALVTRTASFTRKGELLRDVIAFRRHQVQYEVDLPYAVLLLFLYSAVLCLVVIFMTDGERIVAWFLGIVAISNALPPLLPLSFTVPLGYSFDRLSHKRVVCSNSDGIPMAGEVTRIFFDKTGTLTRSGLDYTDCRSVEKCKFVNNYMSPTMAIAVASCHTLVTSSQDGSLVGNPIDRAMFASSQASMPELGTVGASLKGQMITKSDGTKIQVLRRFDFDHYLMTQSVIVRLEDGTLMAIAKGSGEAIRDRCREETVPDNFDESLQDYARIGIYQIAVAFKKLPSSGTNVYVLTREQIEEDMTMAGTLSFANKLRNESSRIICSLLKAGVQPVMLTGDSLYAGIHIAREIGIIDRRSKVTLGVIEDVGLDVTWLRESGDIVDMPLLAGLEKAAGSSIVAMTGEAWRFILKSQPEYAVALASYIRVVGRCTPHDKVSIVDTFVGLETMTMMVGDGGNDCGALRAAHVGLALSDGDASFVAPFTSLDKNIESVLTVLKEGRAALHSTLAVYRYIVFYGNITSYCQVALYWFNGSYTEWQWTFLDGIYTVLFSLTLPLSKPAQKLAKFCPTASLLSPHTVLSVVGTVVINYCVMAWAIGSLYSKDWFQCRKYRNNDFLFGTILLSSDNYETQVIFLVVAAQCIIAAMTCNFGYEFRLPWYRNYLFVLIALGASIIHVYITLVPSALSCFFRVNCLNEYVSGGISNREAYPVNNPFNTTVMPVEFRWELLGIMIANGLAVASYDYFYVNGFRKRAKAKEKQAAEGEDKPFSNSVVASGITLDLSEKQDFDA